MVLTLTLLFPLLLLALPLLMERVERPLRSHGRTEVLAGVMPGGVMPAAAMPAAAMPDPTAEELEHLASQEYAPAVKRFWRRRR